MGYNVFISAQCPLTESRREEIVSFIVVSEKLWMETRLFHFDISGLETCGRSVDRRITALVKETQQRLDKGEGQERQVLVLEFA